MSKKSAATRSKIRAGTGHSPGVTQSCSSGRPLPRKRRIQEELCEAIWARITNQGLAPGDHLGTTQDLADSYGVSHNMAREAVKALETLGLLECRVGGGIYLKEFKSAPLLGYDESLNVRLPGGRRRREVASALRVW